MKKSIFVLLLFSLSLAYTQDKKITQSDLIGYWMHGRIINESGLRIKTYKRSKKGSRSILGLIHFGHDGQYSMVYQRTPQRCGNHRYPKNVYSTFHFNYDKQQVKTSNTAKASSEIWEIIWIDDNTFGRLISL